MTSIKRSERSGRSGQGSCTKCGKKPKGVCKQTGFVYDWCGTCYAEASYSRDDYIQAVGYGDTFGEDSTDAFAAMDYDERMEDAKNTFMETMIATMKKCPVKR